MNQRARNRLIGVTAIILIVIAAIFFGTSAKEGAKAYSTVAEIRKDSSAVGKKIEVGGPVVAGSWDKKTNPMRFAITDKGGTEQLRVVYSGTVPNTFGDGVEAIVRGELKPGGVIEATGLITKCPEKKESGATAMTVDGILANKAKIVGVPVKVTGFVVAGSLAPAGTSPRFSIQTKDGVAKLPVSFDSATPEGFKDGASVVLGGAIEEQDVFDATSVAISK